MHSSTNDSNSAPVYTGLNTSCVNKTQSSGENKPNYFPPPRLTASKLVHPCESHQGGNGFLSREEWGERWKPTLFEKNCNLSETSALHGLPNYMLFRLMTAWCEVNSTKAAGAGFWIGPHHPCKLQIRGQHMWLKTNIKIDMSCTFKQEDTTEPRREKAQDPAHHLLGQHWWENVTRKGGLPSTTLSSSKLSLTPSVRTTDSI